MTRLTCSWIMATVSLFLWTQLHAAPPEELLFGGDYEVQSIVDLNYCEQNKENDDNKADAYKHKCTHTTTRPSTSFSVFSISCNPI